MEDWRTFDIGNPTEEHAMLREMIRDFVQEEVEPQAHEHDKHERFNVDLFRQLGEYGLLGITVPEEYGGAGLDATAAVIANEEISASDPGFGLAYLAHSMLFVNNLAQNGSEEQKQRILPKVCSGEWIGAMAMSEPNYGTDVLGMETTAELNSDGNWVINGNKMWITGAGKADWFFVLAYTNKDAGYKGMSGFIVESNWDGVSLGKKETNMGQRASDTRAVNFENVRVPAANLVGGKEGGGWFNAMAAFDVSRPSIAAHATGISRAAYEHSLQYADERMTFGKKLHQHQAIQFMLADMKTEIEAARLLTWKSAWMMDNGMRNTEFAAHAKRFAADAAMKITTDAVQIFGGYGYSEEYPVARLMRAAKVMQIYEGSSQVQRMIIGREIVRGL